MYRIEAFNLMNSFNFISNNFGINNMWDLFRLFLDVGLVAFITYRLIILVKETRAWQLIKGILIILIAAKISGYFGLQTIAYILDQAVQYIAIALVVIFQPELRRALEKIGRSRFRFFFDFDEHHGQDKPAEIIEEVVDATSQLSKSRTGALVVFERETKVGEVINTGTSLDSNVTSPLIVNLFTPNTPLHDGALIIRRNKIMAAGCFLPLTDNSDLSKKLGTRHRAAIGITEVSDCISVVVSEETGQISLVMAGEIYRDLDKNRLRELLQKNLVYREDDLKKYIWKVKQKP
jgi:diadenylate cyclase